MTRCVFLLLPQYFRAFFIHLLPLPAGLGQSALATEQFGSQADHKPQHGQMDMESLGAVIKKPVLWCLFSIRLRGLRGRVASRPCSSEQQSCPSDAEKLRWASLVSLSLLIDPAAGHHLSPACCNPIFPPAAVAPPGQVTSSGHGD